jgi:hypothetical protein
MDVGIPTSSNKGIKNMGYVASIFMTGEKLFCVADLEINLF